MKSVKSIFINQKGMITIPAELRKKFNLTAGSEVAVVELEGNIVIVPLQDIETTRKISLKDMVKSIDESHEEELKLEQ
jgi:AbrB family looped-hinge helix DNA binding protein